MLILFGPVLAPSLAALLAPRAPAERVAGAGSLHERLAAAGALDDVVRITEGDGVIDILVVAAPECSHCQAMIHQDLPDLAARARAAGIDLAYVPEAFSGPGLAVAILIRDRVAAGKEPLEAVRAGYAAHDVLRAAYVAASEEFQETGDRAAFDLRLDQSIRTRHRALGGDGSLGFGAVRSASETLWPVIRAVSEKLEVAGTPTFLVQAGDGQVLRLEGRRSPEDILTSMVP